MSARDARTVAAELSPERLAEMRAILDNWDDRACVLANDTIAEYKQVFALARRALLEGAQEAEPMQPLVMVDGVKRFRENKIVRLLLDTGKLNLNDLARMDFPQHDREQFAQLIGYSLSGYGELSCVSDRSYERAATRPTTEDTPNA